jgi:carboxyl-terminal processing protease
VVQNFTTNGLPAVPLVAVNRVFVITSGVTASASELVINALRPFKPVITIGGTTYGKPYAFVPQEACGTTYSAVNIEIANALGSADYSAGFAATCPVADDLTRQLGDPLEARLAAALGYVRTGSCPVAASVLQPNKPNAQGNAAQAATKSIVSSALQSDTGYGEISPAQMRMD